MRTQDHEEHDHANLSGSLLVAVPTLLDPNFRRTILFVTQHEREEGALGIILNRPCGHTLGACAENPPPPLREVPVFEGGPVECQHLLLARILFVEGGTRMESFEQDHESLLSPDAHDASHGFRAFTGYAGWSAGQLEQEIEEKSWLILPPSPALLKEVSTSEEGIACWRGIMRALGPWYRLLAEAPDDLSLN